MYVPHFTHPILAAPLHNISEPFTFQNLTEYNTAHNRRISMLGITDDNSIKKNRNKRKRRNVTFNDEECIINPEDVDPNVGRFRNLIQTTVVPTKRAKIDKNYMGYAATTNTVSPSEIMSKHLNPSSFMPQLYQDLPPLSDHSADGSAGKGSQVSSPTSPTIGTKLGLLLPNPAPDVAPNANEVVAGPTAVSFGVPQQRSANIDDPHRMDANDPNEPRKKKYAKEAWPGRKPLLSGL